MGDSILSLLEPLKPFVSFDPHCIDNAVFRLHSKVTVLVILTADLLVTANTFLGDPIDCVVNAVPAAVMDTYCWIHSTFTLPEKHYDSDEVRAHPGVGVPSADEEVTQHKYYQWVVFMLALQAVMFYIPR